MGSTFVTLKEAAQRLKVAESSIQAYVRWGYLRASKNKTQVLLEDVTTLEKELKETPPFEKATLAKLWREHRTMRAELDVLKRIANLHVDPLNLTDNELASFYRLAVNHCNSGCPIEHEEGWLELLSRIQHTDLERLDKLVNDEQPWRPFFQLAAQLSVAARKHLRSSFSVCQNHLKTVAGIWMQTNGSAPTVLDTLPSQILARLQRLQ